jgi:hypothetical protein
MAAPLDVLRGMSDADRRLLPLLLTWSRLEVRPTTRDLAPGLQAQLGDPFWLLARQWQFGELHGEDAGSPVEARLDATVAAVDTAPFAVPLEPLVEAEPVQAASERLRAEAGLHFVRLLVAAEGRRHVQAFIDAYGFVAPEDGLDPGGVARRRLFAGRVVDGARLAADLGPLAAADGTLGGLPGGVGIAAGEAEPVRVVAERWLAWWRDQVFEPDRPSAWNPHRLEYAFGVGADLGDGTVVLAADEYVGGRLDWYSFDAVVGAPAAAPRPAPSDLHMSVLPTRVAYPGMPADRYWAFEDAQVYLGRLEAGPTDLARMLLAEFALAFGIDWFVVPVDLPVGSVFKLRSLVVRDTFGEETVVPPSMDVGAGSAGSGAGTRWTMFGLDGADDLFFLPETVTALEGDPVEEVALFRDEMANLAWGVERVVAGPSGERVDRAHAVPQVTLRQQMPGDIADAQLVYRVMTPVPEHWLPFVPVPVAGRPLDEFVVELERRPMLRYRADGTAEPSHPLGVLLRGDLSVPPEHDALRLAEEEVPRWGAVVSRTFQYGRTADGGGVLWMGRRKRAGRGEGSSGLRFDVADPPS